MKKLILVIILIISTGCNYTELNQISIIPLLIIDKDKEEFKIDAVVIDEEIDNFKIYHGKGKSLTNAINNLDLKLKKKMYLGHLGTIIVSESTAKDGVSSITDYFLKNENSRDNFYILISEDKNLKKIIQNIKDKNISLNNINNIISTHKLSSPAINNTINKFIQNILDKGIEPSLNYINEDLEVKDIAAFKNDKLLLKINEANIISVLKKESDKMILEIKNNTIIIQDLKVFYKKEKDKIKISIIGNFENKDNIEHLVNKKLKKEIEKVIVKPKPSK